MKCVCALFVRKRKALCVRVIHACQLVSWVHALDCGGSAFHCHWSSLRYPRTRTFTLIGNMRRTWDIIYYTTIWADLYLEIFLKLSGVMDIIFSKQAFTWRLKAESFIPAASSERATAGIMRFVTSHLFEDNSGHALKVRQYKRKWLCVVLNDANIKPRRDLMRMSPPPCHILCKHTSGWASIG